jgi:cob(I)alamin adenosyltransferase
MPRIYTRGGDGGESGLVGGERISKGAPRIAAIGEVDELSAVLGLVRAEAEGLPELTERLGFVQRELFALGARLAAPAATTPQGVDKLRLDAESVERLEGWIDEIEGQSPPLHAFVLPGGSRLGALLHLARAVCRRAERSVAALARTAGEAVEPSGLAYLNRLSDLLFVSAREVNRDSEVAEETW